MDISVYAGKRFALLLTDEMDESVAYFGWQAFEADGTLILRREGESMSLEAEMVERIRPVTEKLSEILPDSDFVLPLEMGDMKRPA